MSDAPGDSADEESVLEAVVETAFEHGDGGDGGSTGRRGGTAARLITIAGLVLGGAAVVFVVRRLIADWPQISDQIGEADWRWIGVAAVSAILGMASIGWGWRHVMATLGVDRPLRKVMPWYFVGELGKYVPGGVWPVLGRGELARRDDVPRSRAYASVALSLGMLYLAAMFTAATFLPFALSGGTGLSPWMLVLLALPVGIGLLHHDVLEWLMGVAGRRLNRPIEVEVPRWKDSLLLVLRYVPTWLFIGFATYAVARSISSDISFARMMFATILSWVVGFLAVPVPSGAGIRETVLFAASGAPESVAITTAVGARMIFVLVDVLGAAVCAPFVRKRRAVVGDTDSTDVSAAR